MLGHQAQPAVHLSLYCDVDPTSYMGKDYLEPKEIQFYLKDVERQRRYGIVLKLLSAGLVTVRVSV